MYFLSFFLQMHLSHQGGSVTKIKMTLCTQLTHLHEADIHCQWCTVHQLPTLVRGFRVALLSPRARDRIPAAAASFRWRRKAKERPLAVHCVNLKKLQVVKINPAFPPTPCLIIISGFRQVKLQNLILNGAIVSSDLNNVVIECCQKCCDDFMTDTLA